MPARSTHWSPAADLAEPIVREESSTLAEHRHDWPGRLLGRRALGLVLGLLLGLGLVSCQKDEDPPFTPAPSTTGTLELGITGLPGGLDANVDLTGPSDYQNEIAASTTVDGLLPGTYAVTAGNVSSATDGYTPTPPTQTVVIEAGKTASAGVEYGATGSPFGSLIVNIAGLPAGTDASVTVDGPDGFQTILSGSETLEEIEEGTYTLTSTTVTRGSEEYEPTPPTQDIDVVGGAGATANVAYASTSSSTFDLTVANLYVVQVTQLPNRSVPLVANREALLRVFVTANEVQAVQPKVRVSLYTAGGALLEQHTITTAPPSAPLAVDEGDIGSSWNLVIPGARIFSGVRVLAEVDPDGEILESDELDNVYPSNGVPLSLDVRSEPALNVRFVSVRQRANDLTGDVTASNKDDFVATTSAIYPAASTTTTVRSSVYTTTTFDPLEAGNANGAWVTVLNEIQALRTAESVPISTNFYGVVKTGYTSGVAGVGFVPNNPTQGVSAIGWDNLPTGSGVAAHELGHNFGRSHAPCGNPLPAQIDPEFPQADGKIGAYGYDVATERLYSPDVHTDVMGYCSNQWVSDYTYEGVRSFRGGLPAKTGAVDGSYGPGLLVWGTAGSDGVVLEPAFEVNARASLPSRGGSHVLEAKGRAGETLWRISFEPMAIADLPEGEAAGFAFVIPRSMGKSGAVASLRVSGPRGSASRAAQPTSSVDGSALGKSTADPEFAVRGLGRDRVELRWDATRYPMVMVLDRSTGHILSFARGGSVDVSSSTRELELNFSDGVTSRRVITPVE